MADIFAMTDTWTAVGTTYTAIKMNVTDTASASGSLLLDLQVAAASKFKVGKDGHVTIAASTYLDWAGRAALFSPADAVFQIQNDAGTLSVNMTVGAANLLTLNGALTTGGSITATGGSMNVGTANAIRWSSSTDLAAPTDGSLSIRNSAVTNTFTLTAAGSGVMQVSGPIKLANTYVAGAQVQSGYVTMQDSTGTTYKVLCTA